MAKQKKLIVDRRNFLKGAAAGAAALAAGPTAAEARPPNRAGSSLHQCLRQPKRVRRPSRSA